MWDGNSGMTRFVSLGAFGGPELEAGKKKERVRVSGLMRTLGLTNRSVKSVVLCLQHRTANRNAAPSTQTGKRHTEPLLYEKESTRSSETGTRYVFGRKLLLGK